MREVLSKLARRGWNERPLTEADFDALCEEEGVRVLELAMPERGLYLMRHGYPLIVLQEGLHGVERQFVAWHELAHHLLHTPENCFFAPDLASKFQYQANLVAACALIPQPLLLSQPFAETVAQLDLPPELMRLRVQIYQRSRF
jgi:Zn-dependent peptidase ImmA (M78 family)